MGRRFACIVSSLSFGAPFQGARSWTRRQSWICVLNPSDETFERVKPLLREAYEMAVAQVSGRQA